MQQHLYSIYALGNGNDAVVRFVLAVIMLVFVPRA